VTDNTAMRGLTQHNVPTFLNKTSLTLFLALVYDASSLLCTCTIGSVCPSLESPQNTRQPSCHARYCIQGTSTSKLHFVSLCERKHRLKIRIAYKSNCGTRSFLSQQATREITSLTPILTSRAVVPHILSRLTTDLTPVCRTDFLETSLNG
jgi:hypothetical protein